MLIIVKNQLCCTARLGETKKCAFFFLTLKEFNRHSMPHVDKARTTGRKEQLRFNEIFFFIPFLSSSMPLSPVVRQLSLDASSAT